MDFNKSLDVILTGTAAPTLYTSLMIWNGSNYTSNSIPSNEISLTVNQIAVFLLCLTFTICLLGNSMLCLTVSKCRDMRGGTYFLILNLAIANLGVSLFCMPFTIISLWCNKWMFGATVCEISAFLNILWMTASLFSFAALSLHKYFVIVRPMKRSRSKRRLWILMTVTWVLAVVEATVLAVGLSEARFYSSASLCLPHFEVKEAKTWVLIIMMSVSCALPVSVVIISYWRVLRAVRSHTRRLTFNAITDESSNRATKHFLTTLGIMAVSYVTSWLPCFAIGAFILSKATNLLPNFYVLLALLLAFSTCAQNIVILYLRNKKLRRKTRQTLHSLMCSCCGSENYSVAFKQFQNATTKRRKASLFTVDRQNSNWYVESGFLQESMDCILSQEYDDENNLAIVRRSVHLESVM